jgi:hypothetical protein
LINVKSGAFSFIVAHSVIDKLKEFEKNPGIIEGIEKNRGVSNIK